jgi:proteasome component ECM29
MNFLSFHTASYNITQTQLDHIRSNAAKTSPIMEAIEMSIPQLDSASMADLAPKLAHIIRKGVGIFLI